MEDERELVKDMLRICGIPYTGHLSRSNTHLICKRLVHKSRRWFGGWVGLSALKVTLIELTVGTKFGAA